MKLSIYIERLNKIDQLTRNCKTGTPGKLARKLRMSESRLFGIIEYLRSENVPISYSRKLESYFYTRPFMIEASLKMKELDMDDEQNIVGGYFASNMDGLHFGSFYEILKNIKMSTYCHTMSIKKVSSIVVFIFIATTLQAQPKWDLQHCIDYAVQNNFSIKQADVQQKLAQIQYQQSNNSPFPIASLTNNAGYQFGRSVDPVTNQYTNDPIGYASSQLQASVTLYNWGNLKNTIAANLLTLLAYDALTEKAKYDIGLNVANSYLTAVLAHEQIEIARTTMLQTKEQLTKAHKKVAIGAVPELDEAQIATQFFNDSTNFATAKSNMQLTILQLKAILNIDASLPFDIDTKNEYMRLPALDDMEPGLVYKMALRIQPQQTADSLAYNAAQKKTMAAKAAMMPTISAFANLQTNFANTNKESFGNPKAYITPTPYFISVSGSSYNVQVPVEQYDGYRTIGFVNQFKTNFRQGLGISLQVPIFNGHQLRGNWQTSKLNLQKAALQIAADTQALKQNVYQAYQNAITASIAFQGKKKTMEAAEHTYNLGKKRYDLGLLPVLDMLVFLANLQKAKTEMTAAQFDYMFRIKILTFYKNGIAGLE